jgi:hypothetical protein
MRNLAVAFACVLASTGPAAQERSDGDRRRDPQAWLDAVQSHTPGVRDAAVIAIGPWSLGELDRAAGFHTRLRQPNELNVVVRALVLHADIAMLNREAGGFTLPSASNSVILFADGRAVGRMAGTVHWEFSRRLIDRLPKNERALDVGRRFYRAAGAVLQQWGEFSELTTHLAEGRLLLGEDPVLVMFEGTQHQTYASRRVQRFFDQRRAARSPSRPVLAGAALPSASDARAQAERLFRRALAIDRSLAEARIRLAHILADSNRHDDAVAELSVATSGPLPDVLDYYASIVLGRVERARGRLDAAQRAFERAAARYPDAPSPRLGLSDVAAARGQWLDSARHLPPASPPDLDVDPWWWIERIHEPSADALFRDLRREIGR